MCLYLYVNICKMIIEKLEFSAYEGTREKHNTSQSSDLYQTFANNCSIGYGKPRLGVHQGKKVDSHGGQFPVEERVRLTGWWKILRFNIPYPVYEDFTNYNFKNRAETFLCSSALCKWLKTTTSWALFWLMKWPMLSCIIR